MTDILDKYISKPLDDFLTKPASPIKEQKPLIEDWTGEEWLMKSTSEESAKIMNTIFCSFIVIGFVLGFIWEMSK